MDDSFNKGKERGEIVGGMKMINALREHVENLKTLPGMTEELHTEIKKALKLA